MLLEKQINKISYYVYTSLKNKRRSIMATEERIKKSFVAPEHFEAISNLILSERNSGQSGLNIIVSFREAGEHTIEMIRAGAGAKPHSILAKSIKAGTLTEEEKNIKEMEAIYGLVPTRRIETRTDPKTGKEIKEAKEVTGLYLTSVGKKRFKVASNAYRLEEEDGHPVLKNSGDIRQFISAATADSNFAKYFITGDYDLHDLISLTGQRHPVVSDGEEEAEFMIRLNDAMRGKTVWNEVKGSLEAIHGWEPDEYDLIQHGPQYNYIAYTYNNEKNEEIKEKVARIDTPVAICSPSGWEIKNTPEELVKYYKDHYIKVKDLWQLSEEGERYIRERSGKSFNEFMESIRDRKAE